MQQKTQQNLISPAAADKLIHAHDGDVALLYIYYLRSGSTDPEQAAAELCRTMSEISAAEEKLSRLGIMDELISRPAKLPAAPARELPQYNASDLSRRSKEDANFSVILSEGEKVIGRKLNSNDMKVLFGIYDYLALPAEVILVLLNHCAAVCFEKNGDGRRPCSNFIEKEAYEWAHREIFTLEQADEYIEFYHSRKDALQRIKRILNIHERDFSSTERKDISSWLDMGFTEEAIAVAYDRTIIKVGSLRWNYMKKIILNWQEQGLHTPEEIEAKDGLRSKNVPTQNRGSAITPLGDDIIEKI